MTEIISPENISLPSIVPNPVPDSTPSVAPEIWRQMGMPNYSRYIVSNKGQIYNTKTKYLVKIRNKHGYFVSTLQDDENKRHEVRIHRAVAFSFIGPPKEGQTVDHINRIPADNYYLNLRWADASLQSKNQNRSKRRAGTPICQLDQNKQLIKIWDRMVDAAKFFNITAPDLTTACKKGYMLANYRWMYYQEYYIDPTEIWKAVPHKTIKTLQASNKGRIKNNGKVLIGANRSGYLRVTIYCDVKKKLLSLSIHRLICKTFIGPSKLFVNHKDGNKKNNHLDNLEYLSNRDNVIYSITTGNGGMKLKAVAQLNDKDEVIATYRSAAIAGEAVKTKQANIQRACKKGNRCQSFRWKYVDSPSNEQILPLPLIS
jgi:hypothetical protein